MTAVLGCEFVLDCHLQMIHHRHVASGAGLGQPHQPTATGAASKSFVDRPTTTGSEKGTHKTTAADPRAASHVAEELRGNTPTTATEDGGRRHELPWGKRRRLLGKVALLVALVGVNKV